MLCVTYWFATESTFLFQGKPASVFTIPSTFQRFMNKLFADLLDVYVIVYLDDILIYSKNLTEHRKQVKEVLR